MGSPRGDEQRLQRLLEVGRSLVTELDFEALLHRVLEVARELTGARYAALGILDDRREGLERFITSGVDEETRRAIGELPRGRGILGELIRRPEPLRLSNLSSHPRSYGFPPGHPPMTTFLGVPILIRGEAYGNLYLTEKERGEFDPADEQSLVVLAEWAAIAIENARLYAGAEARRKELEQAVRALEATTAVARAVGAETELDRVLELIVKRGRALVDARAVAILLAEGEELVLAAAAGEFDQEARDIRIPIAETVAGGVLSSGRAERLSGASEDVAPRFGRLVSGLRALLLVPLTYRARTSGVLVAVDRLVRGPEFDDEDERLMQAFAASAATAVATAQSVESERLRHSIEAAEQERRRWARELHDETLQGLGALRLLLETALLSGDPEAAGAAMREAVAQLGGEIEKLQSVIAELRPASLDELGLEAAIESLAERTASVEGLVIDLDLDLPGGRLSPELESTIYRLAQEALTNIGKHARAENVELRLTELGGKVELRVTDDGQGFDQTQADGGYGLLGMRERTALVGGSLEVSSRPGAGTTIRAVLPQTSA
jgi:signal transduction histidine kinase